MRQWTNWQTCKKSWIIWNWRTDIQGVSPENLRKLAHPELEISAVIIISVSKWVNEHTDRHTRILRLFWTMQKYSRKVSQKFRKISHPEPEILTSWVSGDIRTDVRTDIRTDTASPWVDPPPRVSTENPKT